MLGRGLRSRRGESKSMEQLTGQPEDTSLRGGVQLLTEALRAVLGEAPNTAHPRMRLQDLPTFEGEAGEWLLFKRAYEEATSLFNLTDIENLYRLRTALKGEAKEAVVELLYCSISPREVMVSLERRFGRPKDIIRAQIAAVQALQRTSEDSRDFSRFAAKVANCVAIIKQLKRREYLYSPDLIAAILGKLSPILKSKWYDYAEDGEVEEGEVDETDLTKLSAFLNRAADRVARHGEAVVNSTGSSKEGAWRSSGWQRQGAAAVGGGRRQCANVVVSVECVYCRGAHTLDKCDRFKDLKVRDRLQWARDNKKCFRCLLWNHNRNDCKAQTCGVDDCKLAHHKLLHSFKSECVNVNVQCIGNSNNFDIRSVKELALASQTVNVKRLSTSIVKRFGDVLESYEDARYNIESLGSNVLRKCESNVSVLDSARDKSSVVSLDSMLLKGPGLVQSLLSMMMGKCAMKVDIRDMRIEVRENDIGALRSFWRDSLNENPKKYVKSSVLARTSCSLSATEAIMEEQHTDDLESTCNKGHAVEVTAGILEESYRGYEIVFCVRNSVQVLKSIPEERRAQRLVCLLQLVIQGRSCFNLSKGVSGSIRPFKRQMLSIVMFQEVCKEKGAWGSRLSEELFFKWKLWLKHIRKLGDVTLIVGRLRKALSCIHFVI